jgi:hypothetical protein
MHSVWKVLLLSLGLVVEEPSYAQQGRDRNLETCMSGKYPALCNYSRLTPDQLRQVRSAELRENLRVCLTGKYPALCTHSKLTSEQATQVREAERAENLRVCSSGKYPALCLHELLSTTELPQVRAAERSENLRVCMDGRYLGLCNRSLLTPEQARDVAAAEAKVAASRPPSSLRATQRRTSVGDCESGHWIEAVEGDGKIIKLEDGSLWEVNDIDVVTTSIWLPISDVVVCNGKMINVDDGESAEVTPLKPRSGGTGADAPTVRGGYIIEASGNDETFVINGEVFKAKTYCFGFEKGDQVRFLSGSASGACASASILNLRTGKTCKLWCE